MNRDLLRTYTTSWQQASTKAREAFIKAMIGKQYGASETANAWGWFYAGWCAHVSFELDDYINRSPGRRAGE